jgi:D-alanine-D-alanine ligase-like ATP-grasp enzyme
LTNDAIQKYSDNYGKFEAGNKLSYYEFQKYLDIKYKGKYNFNDIYVQMKAVAKAAMLATHKVICGNRRHGLFEIFGMDFMIDDSFKPWLIEINTNPCLETTCPVLERIIPNLL